MDSLRSILQARQTARRDADGGFVRSRAFKAGFGKAPPEFVPQAGPADRVQGIDVSLWQGLIDWPRAKQKGKRFAIIRAGSCTSKTGEMYRDTQFDRNSEQAPDHMVGIGYYWYYRPQHNPLKQADYFSALIRDKHWNMYPMVDAEETGGLDKRGLMSSLWVFQNRLLNNLGSRMMYTSPGFWNSYVYPADWAHEISLVVAHWGVTTPWLPNDWKRYQEDWLFWQTHVGQDGPEHGMQSKGLDHDVFNGNLVQFCEFFGIGSGGEPQPEPVLTHEQRHDILWREASRAGWRLEP